MLEIRQTDVYAKWFSKLRDREARARINVRIRRLSLGNPGDVRPVGEGVSELRIDYGSGYRVYFVQKGSTVAILLAGGDKRTQTRDIRIAHELARNLSED
ncbi:MAG: type II toxin-antitoxin system RelE/ParE family toxin [Caldilineaceae bacterium]|nr:type II toxin-antitoxin system RelE/ParE family toxin [Caldilineaceae bacterium]